MVTLNVHFHPKKSLLISKGVAIINKTGDVQEIPTEVEAKPEAQASQSPCCSSFSTDHEARNKALGSTLNGEDMFPLKKLSVQPSAGPPPSRTLHASLWSALDTGKCISESTVVREAFGAVEMGTSDRCSKAEHSVAGTEF